MTEKSPGGRGSSPKTLFLYEDSDLESFFFEREGDFSRFDGVYINMMPPKRLKAAEKKAYEKTQEALNDFMFDSEGAFKVTDAEKLEAPSKDWTWFVKCGCLP